MAVMIRKFFFFHYIVATLFLCQTNGAAIPSFDGIVRTVRNLLVRQTTSVGAVVNMPPPEKPLVAWAAFGDSFSAGPGAGAAYDNDKSTCWRREGAYAPQLERSNRFFLGYSNPQLNFLSCSGHITTQVQDIQIPSIASALPFMGLIALSIGGNDVGFSKIVVPCVFSPLGSCQKAIDKARDILYGGTFYNSYFSMMDLMINKLNWCPPGGGRTRAEDCFTLVYQTAYPSFFESHTTQCDDIRFFPFVGPKISQALRANLNQIGQEVNTILAYFIANINHQQRQTRNTVASFMVFADQSERFAGHRFCRADVNEPDINNPDTWFFNLRSNPDTAATVFGGTVALGPASDYTAVDPNSCTPTDEIGNELACAISQMVSAGDLAGTSQVIAFTASESRAKSFHPNSNGFGATSAEVQQRLGYVSSVTTGRGCPTAQGLNLRIMGIGDSITAGFRSSDHQGYFTALNENLLVTVEGCPGNQLDFVGTQVSGAFPNEGYSGRKVSEIQALVQQNGGLAQRPNMILLMAGTNDINLGADPAITAQSLSTFIDYLFSRCPDATILVQHIPANGYNTFGAAISAVQMNVIKYNAAISAMVDTRIAQGQHISKVHQRTTTFDHFPTDPLHPDDVGYDLIGEAWTERITVVDQNGWVDAPVAVAGTGSNRKQCLSGLFWDPQGQVANGAGLGKNLYPGITCFPDPDNLSQCGCIDKNNPKAIAVGYALSGPSCADMSYPNATAVHFADLNGDGRAEYLWVGPNGEVTAYFNGGYIDDDTVTDGAHINWVPAGRIASGIGGLRAEIRFADLNGDGRADYLWVHPDGSVTAYLNGGQIPGSATPANINWIPQGPIAGGFGDNGAGTRFANLAGVGRSDYIWVNNVGALTGYLNAGPAEGDGANADHVAWISQGTIATGIGLGRWNTQFGDIDGDGRDDYLGVDLATGAVTEYRNAFGENEGAQALMHINWVPQGNHGVIGTGVGTSGLDIQFADLNGDGRVDYISVDPDTSAVHLWLNRCQHPAGK